MHRMRLSSIVVVSVWAAVVMWKSQAWNLGKTSTTRQHSSLKPIFPQRYRQVNQEEERATSFPLLADFWKLSLASVHEQPHHTVPSSAPKATSPSSKRSTKSALLRPISNAHELRSAILDDGLELKQTKLVYEAASLHAQDLFRHDVIQLIAQRAASKSKPGFRKDNATLALAMEGGGMRGAVSAGMAAAIASLGLCDTFDAVYGSSAGSVVGAYMVSRQMCVDVYTDILPAAQRSFVCKKRMAAGIFASAVDLIFGSKSKLHPSTPGMNISFVLDGIMDHNHGLRPLDLESFRENDKVQPLRIATSAVQDGKLSMKCLGTRDFFPSFCEATNQTISATVRKDGRRQGLYACLEASMTVPGATGPPVLLTSNDNVTTAYFDAFCFEPLPYRSAVEDGATHVLTLRSRPECFQAKTKPGVYERGVAPLYFRSHGEEQVAQFFEKGGQQYIYLEDILTLEEGRQVGIQDNKDGDGVPVPPTTILYGVDKDDKARDLAANRNDWKKAHLLPITVPKGTPELPTLEQGQDAVIDAVRSGFAVAFDMLVPAAGLNLDEGMTGEHVAKLVFPKQAKPSLDVLSEQVSIHGYSIQGSLDNEAQDDDEQSPVTGRKRRAIKDFGRRLTEPFRTRKPAPVFSDVFASQRIPPSLERCHRRDANDLLGRLPGIQNGALPPIAEGLYCTRSLDTLR